MRKKKTLLDKMIDFVNKRKTEALKEFSDFDSRSDDLSLVEHTLSSDKEGYESLSNLSLDDFQTLVKKLYSEKEMDIVNGINGAYYLFKNGIPLVDVQIANLNDLINRAQRLRDELTIAQQRFNELEGVIKDYEVLEQDLSIAREEGFIDNDLVDKISIVFDLDEDLESKLLDEVLRFNYSKYIDFTKSLVVEEQHSMIDINDLRSVFSKYGYDLSSLDSKYVKALQEEGNLENIEGVFRAITSNRMNFLQEKRKAKLLTQFLLNSNENIINEVCSIFKDNYVSGNFFTSYLPVFFPSEDRRIIKHSRKKRSTEKGETKEESSSKENLGVKGLHRDFLKNLEYMKKNFDVEEKFLLERGIRVLTLTHDTLLKHIEELELYGYDIHGSKFPLSAIGASRIMDSTDGFIEIGEEAYIKNFASRLLFTCSDIVKRIYAYKESGLEYRSDKRDGAFKTNVIDMTHPCDLSNETIERLVPRDSEELLEGSKYKELLDTYSPRKISSVTLESPVIKALDEKFMVDESVYMINDVTISRKKVLRNYEFLMSTPMLVKEEKDINKILWVSTINNSLLNSSDLEAIHRGLSEVVEYKGGKHGISKK